jgi:hypothetical protein
MTNTVFWTAKGDVPIGLTPTNLDGVTIGATTPAPVSATTLNASGATVLTGAVTGAGFTAAVAAAGALTTAAGTFVCNGATPVTVSQAAITANSSVIITLKTVGGTVGARPHLTTITVSTGFTVVGDALDTSTYNYLVID